MITGKYINKYYKKYFWFFVVGIIALLLVNYFQLEIPRICGEIIDGVKDGSLFLDENSNRILRYMIYLMVIAIIMFSGRFLWRISIFGIGIRVSCDIREDMFSHSEKLSNQFYKEHKTGALMALYTNDIQTMRQSFAMGTVATVDCISLGSLAIYKMFKTNWILASFSILPMIVLVFIMAKISKVMKKRFFLRQKAYDNISDFSQENFSGISVIKAFVKEYFEIKHFARLNKDYYDTNINYVKLATLLDCSLSLFLSLIVAILLGGGAYFVVSDFTFFGEEFTVGKLWEFVAYFNSVIWPFMAIARIIEIRTQAKVSYKRIEDLLDSKIDIVDDNTLEVDELKGKIEFRNLSYKYPDGSNNVLDNISFTINAGEMVGIIGKTGCGKTTIVDLLLRTYNLEPNTLFLDDIDIMSIPYKKVRDSIGYVPQDNFLFSDTIANNIAFAYDNLNDDALIEAAARLSDVHNNIIEFHDQYQTILGERGVTLSGGQKQRVSIARAVIKDPKILILDDSVSAVDTKTEEHILTNLRSMRQGKTTIMIAHRISTVESLDKIIVMDEGRVIGVGSHSELMKTNELYQEMVHLQSLEEMVNGGED